MNIVGIVSIYRTVVPYTEHIFDVSDAMMSIEIEKPTTRGRWLAYYSSHDPFISKLYGCVTNIAIGIAGGMDEDLGMTVSFCRSGRRTLLLVGYIFCKFPAVR